MNEQSIDKIIVNEIKAESNPNGYGNIYIDNFVERSFIAFTTISDDDCCSEPAVIYCDEFGQLDYATLANVKIKGFL